MKIGSCVLAVTGDYTKHLDVNDVGAIPSHVELVISSQLRTARNPKERQVCHRAIVERARIPSIIAELQKALP